MRIHTPTPYPRESGDFPVIVNPGHDGKPFATINLSADWQADIALDSLDDADRLIRAAVDAKRKMSAAIAGQRHEFAADAIAASWCAACGLIRGNAVHDAPSIASDEAAAVLAASIAAGTTVTVCECYRECGDCSLSGTWHVHAGEPCPVHPDAPGDYNPDAGTNRPDDPDGHAARASLRIAGGAS